MGIQQNLIAALGIWGDSSDFPRADWKYEVQNGDTQLGYWDWVDQQDNIRREA